jgi:hypothetical protein
LIQPKTTEQKEAFKKIAKKADKDNYVWDSFTKRYLPKEYFYADATRSSGYASMNKFIKSARYNLAKYQEKISKLPKKEQTLLAV